MICPAYFKMIDILMGISTGRPYTQLDLTEYDIIESVTSALAQTVYCVLDQEAEYTFYHRDETMAERAESRRHWDCVQCAMGPIIVSKVEDELSSQISDILDDCWDYAAFITSIIEWSDLNDNTSPAIQFYHKLIALRDDVTSHSSFAMPYVFSWFSQDMTQQLTDAGYFGSDVPRMQLNKIPEEYRIPF